MITLQASIGGVWYTGARQGFKEKEEIKITSLAVLVKCDCY